MSYKPLPRVHLGNLPTPLEPLPRLTAFLGGPKIWIKRDDLTGLALGGNKTRKLEFLLAEAQAHGARMLITCGAGQSNHCRQTAAAAARAGLDCILVLGGSPPSAKTGNVLLDGLFGAEVIWAGISEPADIAKQAFERTWAEGRRPYLIPLGGSSAVGIVGYVEAMSEFLAQNVKVDRILFASSSGGTQAGLVVGAALHGFPGEVLGISVDKTSDALCMCVAHLAKETFDLLGQPIDVSSSEIHVNDQYLGGGYGVMGEVEKSGIDAFARSEGLLLDPVYTGRAAGAMIDLIHKGKIGKDESILFWHTGGTPALFAYADRLG